MRGWVAALPLLLVALPQATARAEPVLRPGTTSAAESAPSPWPHLMSATARLPGSRDRDEFAAVARNGSLRGNAGPATPTWAISQARRNPGRDAATSLGALASAASATHRIVADASRSPGSAISSGLAPAPVDTIASALRLPQRSFGGEPALAGFSVVSNPEPGTMALFGAGALGLGAFAWRRRRRARAAAPKS